QILRIHTVALAAMLASITASAEDVIRLSDPVVTTSTHETFGAPIDNDLTPITLSELIDNAGKHANARVAVRTRIAKVCQKKGCFFMATEGSKSARITFRDYGFFVPTDSAGKAVDLVGTFERVELDAAKADHYAKDLGEDSAARGPSFEYRIVADAVRIPKS
ncbi:MAG: DUF4920 domain-containing protein, partial [Pseudomonadota bacterium]